MGQITESRNDTIVNVTIMDDDTAFAARLKRLIERSDGRFCIATESDPVRLLRALPDSKPDVILSDVFMPRMTGIDFIQSLRHIDLDLPVILLTGSPSDGILRRAVELGAHGYLTKPPDIDSLVVRLRNAAFDHRLAALKRRVFELDGTEDNRPGDKAGLQDAFQEALAQLKLAYQPIVHGSSGKIHGFEALIRSEYVRLSGAMAVVEAAHDLQRTTELTDRVLSLLGNAPLPVSAHAFVNVVPEDLTRLSGLFSTGRLSEIASRIVLELSERHRLERVPDLEQELETLRNQGLRFAIDDFGTGTAGVVNFAALEPEYVKVDYELIRNLTVSAKAQSVVRSLLSICRDRGSGVVAEGVENEETLQICRELGFDYIQGFHIDRPSFAFPNRD